MSFRARHTVLGAVLCTLLTLTACGGGGGSSNSTNPTPDPHQTAALQITATAAVQQGLAGVVVAHLTAQDGWQAQAGVRQIGSTAPIVGNEPFVIGSTTKALTAALAGRLVERGLIAWTTPLAEALPDLAAGMLPAYRSVTLEQLLGHRGGLPAFNNASDLLGFQAFVQAYPGPLPDTLAGRERLFTAWLLAQEPPPQLKPGETYSYSNAGYAVAALMLETRAGRPYAELMQQELAQPLGLTLSWTGADQRVAGGATGHTGTKGQLAVVPLNTPEVAAWLDVLRPAGFGLTVTPASYAAWVRWHLKALQGGTTPLASPYVQRLKALKVGEYGLGWVTFALEGRPMLFHDGEYSGFTSLLVIDQAGRSASFAFTNTAADDSSWTVDVLSEALLAVEHALPPP